MIRHAVAVFAVALTPLLVGGIASALWESAGENRLLTLRFDLAWIPAWIGGLISLVLLVGAYVWLWMRYRSERAVAAALEAEDDRYRRFLARLDHEMKNPIQGIRLALADGASEQQQASIDLQTKQLSRLLTDLRRLSEAELVELELAPVDPSELIQEAVEATKELPEAADRLWHVSIPQAPRPLPEIRGDVDLLFFALANLLSNAVKYSRSGDRIEVRAAETVDGLTIEIADTGFGIPEDEQETVWEDLGRGREARGREGSGLGLPFVKSIVKRHGGTIEMHSTHGEGTSMAVTLPLAH